MHWCIVLNHCCCIVLSREPTRNKRDNSRNQAPEYNLHRQQPSMLFVGLSRVLIYARPSVANWREKWTLLRVFYIIHSIVESDKLWMSFSCRWIVAQLCRPVLHSSKLTFGECRRNGCLSNLWLSTKDGWHGHNSNSVHCMSFFCFMLTNQWSNNLLHFISSCINSKYYVKSAISSHGMMPDAPP